MKRTRPLHCTVLALAFPLVLAVLLLGGFVPARAEKKPEVKLDAPAATKGLRVAAFPVVNGTAEVTADKIMEDILREAFKEVDRSRAMFLMPSDVEQVLGDADALDRGWKLTDRWSRSGALDSTAIAGMDSLLLADAVLLIKISEWETKRAHNINEGQSSTSIGLHLALFRIQDRKKLWSKDVREQRLAREIDLTSSTVGYDETGRIMTPKSNDPPRVHDVASDLIRDALKKFPNK